MLCHKKSRKVAACRVRLSRWKCRSGDDRGCQGGRGVHGAQPGYSLPHPGLCPCTCVGQQGLKRGPHTFVGQQLFGGLVPQEHTQHGLGFMAMP